MLARLRRFLAPPVFPDENDTRTAALLNEILWVALMAIAVFLLLDVLFLKDIVGLIVVVAFGLLMMVLWWVLRCGAVSAASLLFCGLAFAGLAVSAYLFGGVTSASFSALVITILIAGILISGRVALLLAAASSGVGLLLLYAENAGWLIVTSHPVTAFATWFSQSLIFLMVATVLGLLNRNLRQALTAERKSQSELQQRTQELEQERSALRASEERYRNFIEQSMEGIWRLEFDQPIPIDLPPLEQVHLIHDTGYITECNEAMARMYGYTTQHDMLGRRLLEVYGGTVKEANVQAGLTLVKEGYRSSNREIVEFTRLGEPIYFLNNWVGVIRDDRLIALWGAQRDVTDRKLIEQMLARRARHLQIAADVSRAVASILDLPELLARIVDLLQSGFNLQYVGLFLRDEHERRAILRAATGPAGQQLLQAGYRLAIDDQSMVGWCMSHGQVRLAEKVDDDPVHLTNPLIPSIQSEIALPLINWGRVIGAITLQSDRPRDFTTDDATVLQTMADQVAIAINNARLFEAEKRHGALMTALHDIGLDLSAQLDLATLLQTIVQRAAQLLGAPVGELLLMQPDDETLREAARFAATPQSSDIRLGEGISHRVAETGEPLIIEDYGQWPERKETLGSANFRSALGVPVQWHLRVLGVLNVLDNRPARFDQADATVLQLFAVQAALAIENARLFEAAWRQVNELNILHEIALAANTAVEEQKLIGRAMEVLGGTLNIDYLGLWLKDEAQQALRVDAYFQGARASLPTEMVPFGQGVTGTVALTGRAHRIDDVRLNPGYYPYHADSLSELCVPLKVGDRILGVINGESRQPAAFSEADEQLLSTVAGQLGTAIDRLRTEAARRQNEEELAQERNLLRTLIDNLSDTHIFVKDTHSRFITTNAEHLRIMGLTGLEQVVGKTDFDFFDRVDAEQYYADDQAVLNTGAPVLGRVEKIRDANGQTRWYLTNKIPLRDKDGKPSGLVGVSVNITERQRSAEREQAIARGLQAVVEAADEILQIDDLDLFYRRAVELAREKMNVERCGIFLLDAEHQLLLGTYGTDLQRCTTDERDVKTALSAHPEYFALGTKRRVVLTLGQGYWAHGRFYSAGTGWVALTVIGPGPEPIGIFFNDAAISRAPLDEVQQETLALYSSLLGHIIIRKRAAQEREMLINELEDKNAELERFTYPVSHDLKSPLITIRGFMSLLIKDTEAGQHERMREDLARISQATDKMQQLLNELLELSRIGRLMNAPERVSLENVVREALSLVEGRLGARGVRVEVAPQLPEVFGDRVRLVEVMQNLLDNAVKFMGDQAVPRIEIGVREETSRRVFFVRDNGLGIEPRFHDRVFGLFDKLDPRSEGTGIGLALVKRIIEVHGGRIWVESEGQGQGATFCFTLPAPV